VSWSANGEPTFGAATTIKCRFEEMDYQVRDVKEQLIHITGKLWVGPKVTIATNDKVTISGTSYKVVKKTTPRDVANRVDHIELLLTEY